MDVAGTAETGGQAFLRTAVFVLTQDLLLVFATMENVSNGKDTQNDGCNVQAIDIEGSLYPCSIIFQTNTLMR